MRFFIIFFALHLALLGCLSCADGALASSEGGRSYVSAAREASAPALDRDSDWCSPLCQCHVCPGTTLPFLPAVAFAPQAPRPAAGPRYARMRGAAPRQVPQVVWQPPQA